MFNERKGLNPRWHRGIMNKTCDWELHQLTLTDWSQSVTDDAGGQMHDITVKRSIFITILLETWSDRTMTPMQLCVCWLRLDARSVLICAPRLICNNTVTDIDSVLWSSRWTDSKLWLNHSFTSFFMHSNVLIKYTWSEYCCFINSVHIN